MLFILFVYCFSYAQTSYRKLALLSASKKLIAIDELKEFVALPNDALFPKDIEKNIAWLEKAFERRKFSTKILPTARTPLFFAEKKSPGASHTILFYMHFDGQSVDPTKWDQGDPYTAVLKKNDGQGWEKIDWSNLDRGTNDDWRIFGRSTSDAKGPIVMFLQALDIMEENNLTPASNIKVILDGEEEKGSAHLAATVDQYKNLLSANHMIINDGPMHLSGEPTIVFGCRGVTRLDLTVYGPAKHQHSGHYGNYAPNAAFRLSRLLASMKNKEGKVLIEGYYDGIELGEEVKGILAKVPDDPQLIHSTIGIADPEKVGANLQEALQYPSLNVRGLSSAWVGDQARTIVPAEATAAIDLRLVPESDPVRLHQLIKDHIVAQGYFVVDREPTMEERLSYPKIARVNSGSATLPFRTNIGSPTGNWVTTALTNAWDKEPVKIRIMGGTVPISPFINGLDIPAVIVPLVNPDNNQHSPDENLRIGNLTNGIQTFLALLLTSPGPR